MHSEIVDENIPIHSVQPRSTESFRPLNDYDDDNCPPAENELPFQSARTPAQFSVGYTQPEVQADPTKVVKINMIRSTLSAPSKPVSHPSSLTSLGHGAGDRARDSELGPHTDGIMSSAAAVENFGFGPHASDASAVDVLKGGSPVEDLKSDALAAALEEEKRRYALLNSRLTDSQREIFLLEDALNSLSATVEQLKTQSSALPTVREEDLLEVGGPMVEELSCNEDFSNNLPLPSSDTAGGANKGPIETASTSTSPVISAHPVNTNRVRSERELRHQRRYRLKRRLRERSRNVRTSIVKYEATEAGILDLMSEIMQGGCLSFLFAVVIVMRFCAACVGKVTTYVQHHEAARASTFAYKDTSVPYKDLQGTSNLCDLDRSDMDTTLPSICDASAIDHDPGRVLLRERVGSNDSHLHSSGLHLRGRPRGRLRGRTPVLTAYSLTGA